MQRTLSVARHKNVGIRYLLFIIPICCVWIGRLACTPSWLSSRWGRRWAVGLCLGAGWLAVEALGIWPDYLSYFNLACGGPSRGHRYLLDSNLDWGQDLIALREYLEQEGIEEVDLAYFGRVDPQIYGIRYRDLRRRPRQRYAVVSANMLWGLTYFVNGKDYWPPREAYARFRRLKPKAVLGHTLYVFDLEEGK